MAKEINKTVQKVTDLLNKNHIVFCILGINPSHEGFKYLSTFPWKIYFTSNGKIETFDFFQGRWHTTKYGMPKKPNSADVLYCVILDADAWNYNFYSWCDNYGYAVDSMEALKTYTACLENAKKLRNIFTIDQLAELKELLQDY